MNQLNELSALYDGELEPHEVHPVLRSAADIEELRRSWQTYALIGDCLRGERVGGADLTARVMERLSEEPVVLAPRNVTAAARARTQTPLMALAASLAGVAVVGWLAIAGHSPSPASGSRIAAVSPAPTFVAAPAAVAVVRAADSRRDATEAKPARDISEYLVAHQAQTAAFRIGDAAHQVRTVSLIERARHP
jgi:sigma-E factor negative regulatory protein RseA